MAEIVIHPTRRWIKLQYTIATCVLILAVFLWVNYGQEYSPWLLVIPALLYLWPLSGSISRRFTKMVLSGDKLRYETGMFSRSVRTVQLSKIQDVRWDQTLFQRLVGIGTVSFETAGETSRLTMVNLDDPQAVAEQIIDAAHGTQAPPPPAAKRKGERG